MSDEDPECLSVGYLPPFWLLKKLTLSVGFGASSVCRGIAGHYSLRLAFHPLAFGFGLCVITDTGDVSLDLFFGPLTLTLSERGRVETAEETAND